MDLIFAAVSLRRKRDLVTKWILLATVVVVARGAFGAGDYLACAAAEAFGCNLM